MPNDIKFSWSEITCGHSCWYAKQDECKCSCGGKNHGVLLQQDNAQPQRTMRTKGTLYYLQSIGNQIELLNIINDLLPIITGKANANTGQWINRPTAPGVPLMLKFATFEQAQKWAELSSYKDIAKHDFYFHAPALLWRREDVDENLFN